MKIAQIDPLTARYSSDGFVTVDFEALLQHAYEVRRSKAHNYPILRDYPELKETAETLIGDAMLHKDPDFNVGDRELYASALAFSRALMLARNDVKR